MNSDKKLIISMACVACILLAMCLPASSATDVTGETKEIKPDYALKFCGEDFIKYWEKLCEIKKAQLNHGRKRRDITGKRFNISCIISILHRELIKIKSINH